MVRALGPHCSADMFDWARDSLQGEILVQASYAHPSACLLLPIILFLLLLSI